MGNVQSELVLRAEEYCRRRNRTVELQLGSGFDGLVLSTAHRTAIKVFRHPSLYRNELAVYQRLQQQSVDSLEGFSVRRLLGYHDELHVIEMEAVKPPFVVDFTGAYLDERPPFSAEEWAEWEADRSELFGDDWPSIRSLLSSFRGLGIFLNDVKPGNITVR